LLHRSAAVVLDENVRAFEQRLENLPVCLRFQIKRDRFLAAIDRHEIAGLRTTGFLRHERTDCAGIVARFWWLNLDHACAEFGHQERAIWSRENPCQIDDKNVGERSFWSLHRPVRARIPGPLQTHSPESSFLESVSRRSLSRSALACWRSRFAAPCLTRFASATLSAAAGAFFFRARRRLMSSAIFPLEGALACRSCREALRIFLEDFALRKYSGLHEEVDCAADENICRSE